MRQHTGFRLSEEALRLLDALATRHGLNRTAALEMLIREAARQQGIDAVQFRGFAQLQEDLRVRGVEV